jgi:hypothetical protein
LPPRGQRFVGVDGQPPVGCCIRCWYGVCTITSDAEARCARDAAQFLRPSPAAALCNLFGDIIGWLRGQSEVAMCVMLTHGTVRTIAAVGRRCTHRTSAHQKSSSRSVGHPTRCWLQLVGCFGDPLRRLRKRAALAPSRETIQHAWAAILHLMALFDRPVASCRILLPCRGFPVQGSSIRERSTRTLGFVFDPAGVRVCVERPSCRGPRVQCMSHRARWHTPLLET